MGNKLRIDLKKYVHIRDETTGGIVEFDFSIGDPTMYVELALPKNQFEEFCDNNKVEFLTENQLIDVENDKHKWKYGVPGTLKHTKSN